MARKKPSSKKYKRAKAPNAGLTPSVRKRLVKIPGKERQRLDPKTGKLYSRRQFEKGRVKTPRRNQSVIARKYGLYKQIRDSYIAKKERDGKKITKREAMNSEELKKIIKDLHSKNYQTKYKALQKTMRGDKIVEKDGMLQSLKYTLN